VSVAANVAGEPRTGVVAPDGSVRFDRSSDPLVDGAAFAAAANQPGAEQTYTCNPLGTGKRAVDRDGDGVMNGDEIDEGTNPADPMSLPLDCAGGELEAIDSPKVKI